MKTHIKFPAYLIAFIFLLFTSCFEENPFDDKHNDGNGEIVNNDSTDTDSLHCPELHFTYEHDSFGVYIFTADFEKMEETPFSWYVDGEPVGQIAVDSANYTLFWQFNPGTHRICIKASNDECGELIFCESITYDPINYGCPNLSFTKNALSSRNYEFFANISNPDSLAWYGWMVNGEVVENDGYQNNGDNYFNYIFEEEGYYEICLITETPECPESVSYCENYYVQFDSIPNDSTGTIKCRQLGFNYAKDHNDSTYTFTADFEAMDSVSYSWSVYINGDYQGGKTRRAGSESGHTFTWYFESDEEYVVCLKQVDGDCGNYQLCEEISF
ncbi:hypothetical protein OO013_11030 [Mangrovivirga sp. M17]|uniref:PKD domain-containing protein n=1 Tax=Mangrovivirga halotolerans TaxID=2993936 RepID=A0ABT3RRK0_9BACT|nr:hypothetical protein [Mangrovivirga halotolerans]MCX2744404.1 hypothetical protein [Mangrovivirga halotolerans]